MRARSLAHAMAGLRRRSRAGPTTLASAADMLADRSVLVLIMLLAMLGMVPSPGLPLGAITGLLVVWLAAARLMGRRQARLPEALSRRPLPPSVLQAALRRLVPLLRRMERRVAVRMVVLASGPGAVAALVGIVVQGLVLALPVPLGNVPPALSILALAGGLVWRDGLCVLAGHVLSVTSVAIVGLLAWGGAQMLSLLG